MSDLFEVSTDDFAGWLALQTNLALKGIIGINAMSQIADIAGEASDAAYFKVSDLCIVIQHADETVLT